MEATEQRLQSLQAINQRNIDDYFKQPLSQSEVRWLIECYEANGGINIEPSRLNALQHFLKVINPSSVASL